MSQAATASIRLAVGPAGMIRSRRSPAEASSARNPASSRSRPPGVRTSICRSSSLPQDGLVAGRQDVLDHEQPAPLGHRRAAAAQDRGSRARRPSRGDR